LVLPSQPCHVVAEGPPQRSLLNVTALDRLLIQREELIQDDCGAPAIQQDVVETPDHPQPRLLQLDGRDTHQRWAPQIESLSAVLLQQYLKSALLRVWIQIAPVQSTQVEWCLGLDRLHRLWQSFPDHRGPKYRVPLHQFLPGAFEDIQLDASLQVEDR